MEMLNQLMALISRGVVFGGTIYTLWNGIQLGFSLKDHNGPEMKSSLLGIAGGVVVIVAAALFTQVNF